MTALRTFGGALAVAAIAVATLSACSSQNQAAPGGGTSGAGIGVWPACSSTPGTPGHTLILTSGGWAGTSGTPAQQGIQMGDTGSGNETLTMSVQPVPAGTEYHGLGLPVPPAWVHFTGSPAALTPGQYTAVQIAVSIPATATKGTYVAELDAAPGSSTTTTTTAVSNAGATTTSLVFTVGIKHPVWPAQILGSTDPCWALPGQYETWQQWAQTPTATTPPGWYWGAACANKCPAGYATVDHWMFQPAAGWTWGYPNGLSNAGQWVFHGATSVTCVSKQTIKANGWAGSPGRGPWLGSIIYPDTSSSTAGCRAWLHQHV
jgi:hypothetical protein